jgi:hypothetical protein
MAITKKAARQKLQVAKVNFTFADLTSGSYAAAVDLPLGAIVLGGGLFITTLFNSGTDDKFSIGDKVGSASADVDTYAAISADIAAVGRAAAIVPTGVKTTEETSVGVVWTGTGTAATAGAGLLVVEYIIDGQTDSTFEN